MLRTAGGGLATWRCPTVTSTWRRYIERKRGKKREREYVFVWLRERERERERERDVTSTFEIYCNPFLK